MTEPETPANRRKVRTGGLMRCCTLTLREAEELTDVGSTLQCRYCSAVMAVAEDGVWEWVAVSDRR